VTVFDRLRRLFRGRKPQVSLADDKRADFFAGQLAALFKEADLGQLEIGLIERHDPQLVLDALNLKPSEWDELVASADRLASQHEEELARSIRRIE
jgi:hypothetical protein